MASSTNLRDSTRPNDSLHKATTSSNTDKSRDHGQEQPKPSAHNISLRMTYFLWAFFGFTGVHHAYLGRPFQAVGWYATGAMFGFGWIRDSYMIPYYVRLARSEKTAVRLRALTIEAKGVVPNLFVMRLTTMAVLGCYLGWIVSCLVVLPTTAGWSAAMYWVLRIIGMGIGIWWAGNMGEYALLGAGYPVITAVFVVGLTFLGSVFGHPVVGGAFGASCFVSCFTALLSLALYNHGAINVNGSNIYFHEAIKNVYQSRFWNEFNWQDFQQQSRNSSGSRGNYLKQTFDIDGERAARRTLGVSSDASHGDVRAAYKRLALKYHPDKRRPGTSVNEQEKNSREFNRVQEAYETLSKIEQRRKKGSNTSKPKLKTGESGYVYNGRNSHGDEM